MLNFASRRGGNCVYSVLHHPTNDAYGGDGAAPAFLILQKKMEVGLLAAHPDSITTGNRAP
jgi:hypothetical protein